MLIGRDNNEVKYALEGSIFVSGSLIQWLRDGLGIIKSAKDTEEIALSVSSSNDVVIVPAFTGIGAPYWNQECRGAIFGLTRGADYRHIVRASLEAMAYQSKDLLDVMEEEANTKIVALKVDGGASENKFLLQFQSDILQINVVKGQFSETTALGAARLAGLASNVWTIEDFKNQNDTVYDAKMAKDDADALYAKWQKAVESCIGYK